MVVPFTIKEKLLIGNPITRYGAASFLFTSVVLSSKIDSANGLVSGIATKTAIDLSKFRFTN